ncbi:HU family DNA-binding protein [Candidatus Parcubacteria bacterium]|nr:MAG: HU family DNA-binding protein [Candidatus Parcubacteria bacterium]
MNKAQLVESIAIKAGVSKKEAEDVLQALEDLVIERLKDRKEVTLTGFGTFSARVRHARKGVNPQKPSERIDIPEVVVPKFKAGKTLKDALKK